jgi:hypothetical protein
MTDRICTITGCDRPLKARGWCSTHYEQWRTTGDPIKHHSEEPDLPGERWRPVVGYEGYYDVSNLGRVRSLDRLVFHKDGKTRRQKGVVLSPGLTDTGRLTVSLSVSDVAQSHHVPNLVLIAFVGQCPPNMECCHENGTAADNRLSNLRWDTHSSNMLDKQRHGTDHMRNRIECPLGHKLVEPNLVVNVAVQTGHRNCLACALSWQRVRKARRRGIELDRKTVADECYERVMNGTTSSSKRYDLSRCRKGLHDITVLGGIYIQPGNGKRSCAECRKTTGRTTRERRRLARADDRLPTLSD